MYDQNCITTIMYTKKNKNKNFLINKEFIHFYKYFYRIKRTRICVCMRLVFRLNALEVYLHFNDESNAEEKEVYWYTCLSYLFRIYFYYIYIDALRNNAHIRLHDVSLRV